MFQNLLETIGNTPLIRAKNIEEAQGLKATLLVKQEGRNPLGSAKDRAALYMLKDAVQKGLLQPGGIIIEPTSGNTGVGLAYQCALLGYRLILTMPESMSEERKSLLRALGAELVLTPAALGMGGSVEKAQALKEELPGAIILGQFDNPANALAHYETTGPEVWRDTEGNVDAFVACVGTGGSITGTVRFLKEQNPNIQGIAIEPAESPLLSGGTAAPHKIQGIGANFIPSVLDRSMVDRVITVSSEEAYEGTRMLMQKEGLFCGISSGAALMGALKLLQDPAFAGKTVVALLPDTGERYLSTGVFDG